MPSVALPYLDHVLVDSLAIAGFARAKGSAAVPSCPGWDVIRLAGHVGRVHRMAHTSVSQQLTSPPAADQSAKPPADPSEVADWLAQTTEALLPVLRETAADSPAWNFTQGPQTAAFWPRRMAHETAIHRWDADMAVNGGGAAPMDAALSVDGVDEFLSMFTRVLGARPEADIGGSLHLHATDAEGEWMIEVTDGQLTVEHGHGKGDAAIRGTASDLLLGVWGRRSFLTDNCFQRFGDDEVVTSWMDLGAF